MVFRIINRLIRALRVWYYGSTRNESADRYDTETVGDLSNSCLRGLRKPEWVDDRFLIATEAFIPNAKTAATRKDGGQETSVNWEDDSRVEKFTLTDKNGQYGAARIFTIRIVQTSEEATGLESPLSCERHRLPGNNYHGNIVFSVKLKKRTVNMLAASLALKSRFVPPLSGFVK